MGHIDRFDIKSFVNDYGVNYFVETGTGLGVSLEYVLQFEFSRIFSIEIVKELYDKAKEKFKNNNCTLINDNSKDGLTHILNNIEKGGILFWLDAHFPGADFGLTSYDSTTDGETRIPLESELRAIVNVRDVSGDVFVIDDLRIYEDNNYSGGNWSDRRRLGGDGIGFIYELFDETHNIERDLRDQGYIILTPKKIKNDNI